MNFIVTGMMQSRTSYRGKTLHAQMDTQIFGIPSTCSEPTLLCVLRAELMLLPSKV